MKVDPMGTLPLFKPAKTERTDSPKIQSKPGAVTWSRYRPKYPPRCDDCVAILIESDGKGPIASKARFKRTVKGEFRLLCGAHAQQWRVRDKLPKFRGIA
jgi:hypothetical protein